MSYSDPIADMLTRLKNAALVRREQVLIPSSRMKLELMRILKEEGFVQDYDVTKDQPRAMIRVRLKYTPDHKPVLTDLKRVSKPGRRVYAGKKDIPWVLSGLGIAIVSTPQGIMTGREARRRGLGGEVICYVW
jgi:small subunit ribosomal protein S8